MSHNQQPASEKTCLVTGGAGGLGKAIATAFLEAGANVIVCDINAERLSQTSTELAKLGSFTAVAADITSADAMQRLCRQIIGDFRTLDILVNNAAVMDRFDPVADLDMDLWHAVLAVNLTAPMLLSKLAVRLMLEKPDPSGCIINIASSAAKAGAAYTTSKHGIIGLTKSTAAFYGDKGIRCNALAMGVMLGTNIGDAFQAECHREGQQKVMDLVSGTKPRSCHVQDVASLCVSLSCGPGWNLVNGSVIAVDHGPRHQTMNVVDPSQAPPEYQRVAWMADTCKLLMGIGWTANYIGMIYTSLQHDTYAMSLMALCCNFAWEVTYALIYPFGSRLEKSVHYSGLVLNCGVMYTAVKNAPREWTHAPLVQRHVRLIFVLCLAGWTSAHMALAAQLGPLLAQAWSAYGCQLLLSVGGLCQLLCRGHSRGSSYLLWFSRFFGSLVLVPHDILRYRFWRKDHEYMASPLYLWFICIFLLLDGAYAVCLWHVRRFEREREVKRI
ncbi:hypothetical protein L249_3754 [Ophiocordyceps polyrhachis-furcata BCC 54312]|uniref:Uncharacterized protein n=1 Tax=Ophiocordyceps polyrhachis-furcata BCC 54312 TaxID=1330021 RepID=A0A367L4T7_9HYPO|nr:hypothetical protein L249_3754 [Ophiocordyceps polyrhachis-furcata BCC 54312]